MAAISRIFRHYINTCLCRHMTTNRYDNNGRVVNISKDLTINEMAKKLNTSSGIIIRILQQLGENHSNPNTRLSTDIAELIALDLGYLPNPSKTSSSTASDRRILKWRPPVITVMGHVDHGKTTLLDSLRKTSVALGEPGGITQHIGAFSVPLIGSDQTVTFLDTPGHAAFTSMRSRGVSLTDIVVLVVAADDGVMPQTVECIQLAKDEGVPLVVAINKCDKYDCDPSKVKHQLLQYEVQLEEFGGETQSVEISALTGNGLDQLIEAILLQAELKELTADPSGPVDGVIIEAKTVKSTGFMATVLVLNGTLRRGCILSTPRVWGRVRAMQDDKGRGLDQATPSTPVSVTGWKELPMAGEKCIQVDEVSNAREYIDYHKSLEDKYKLIQEKKLKHQQRKVTTTLKQPTREGKQDWKKNWKQRKIDSLLKIAKEREEKHSEMREEIEVVPLIVKGDVTGSVEALVQLLESCQPKQININVMHSGVGGVTENDVMMANSINGIILAFNIPSTKAIDKLVKEKDVRVIKHNVIYKLLEQLKEWLESKLTPNETEEYLGEATVTRVFKLSGSKKAHVGGCIVVKGELARDGIFQLWRKGKMIHSSKVLGMKREKEDIRIAKKDTECGLSYKDDPGWEEGDRVICLRRTTVPQKLEWNLGFHKY